MLSKSLSAFSLARDSSPRDMCTVTFLSARGNGVVGNGSVCVDGVLLTEHRFIWYCDVGFLSTDRVTCCNKGLSGPCWVLLSPITLCKPISCLLMDSLRFRSDSISDNERLTSVNNPLAAGRWLCLPDWWLCFPPMIQSRSTVSVTVESSSKSWTQCVNSLSLAQVVEAYLCCN